MLFKQSLQLPPKFQIIEAKVRNAERLVASMWPKKVYSETEFLELNLQVSGLAVKVTDCLIECGIFVPKQHCIHTETGFLLEDDFDEDYENYEIKVTYEFEGEFMQLLNELKTTPGALPYFISFHSAGGLAEAKALHAYLQAAGAKGYLSDGIQTGSNWRSDVINALRKAGTIFIFESTDYHIRDRCAVERDFGVTAGKHVLRVGLCKRGELNSCPAWLDGNIQYEEFGLGKSFDLSSLVQKSLPIIQPLDVRRRASIQLIENLSSGELGIFAAKVGLADQLHGAEMEKKGQFVNIAFSNGSTAERFCNEIDLHRMF